jgi:hypothetical protein
VLPACLEIARDIAANTAPLSVAFTKQLLWRSFGLEAREVGRLETELHLQLMGKPDAIEGVRAYLEHRPPRWQLRVSRDWPDWPGWPERPAAERRSASTSRSETEEPA